MIREDLIGMSSNQKVKTMASARALLSSADRVNSLYHQLILLIVYTCILRTNRACIWSVERNYNSTIIPGSWSPCQQVSAHFHVRRDTSFFSVSE